LLQASQLLCLLPITISYSGTNNAIAASVLTLFIKRQAAKPIISSRVIAFSWGLFIAAELATILYSALSKDFVAVTYALAIGLLALFVIMMIFFLAASRFGPGLGADQ